MMQNKESPADRKAQSEQVAAQTISDKHPNPEIITIPPQVSLP